MYIGFLRHIGADVKVRTTYEAKVVNVFRQRILDSLGISVGGRMRWPVWRAMK